METISASVRRTGRCVVVVHEAPVYACSAQIAARVTEQCFYHLEAPVLRVGGFATPYPPSRLEDHYLPDLDRILDAVDRTLGVLMAELKEFRLPDVGEGLTEADIVAWHVKPGDQVEVNQIIVEIETAKAVVELPSPWDGTVVRLLAEEGQTIDVGAPIITVDISAAGPPVTGETDSAERSVVPAPAPACAAAADTAAADTSAAGPAPAEQAPAEQAPAEHAPAEQPGRQPVLVGYGVKASATTRRARKAAPIAAAAAGPTAPVAAAGPSAPPPAVTVPDAPAARAW